MYELARSRNRQRSYSGYRAVGARGDHGHGVGARSERAYPGSSASSPGMARSSPVVRDSPRDTGQCTSGSAGHSPDIRSCDCGFASSADPEERTGGMKWVPWKKPAATLRDSDAKRAQERARLAEREAQQNLTEIKGRSAKARHERETNHFGPLIWKAMGGRSDD